MARTKRKTSKKVKAKPKSRSRTKTTAKKGLEFDRIWKEYNLAINVWKESLGVWQKATNDVLAKYNQACQQAVDADSELLKKVNVSWEDAWGSIGPEYLKQQNEMWENVFKKTNLITIQKFNDQWQKYLTTSGNDSLNAYNDALKYFNAVWEKAKIG